ncbi:hypothetical protein AGMMS49957_15540 [Synergistales bacterium]|nr:hypothetical protein AGMMS49957_15540 [Synergistales bacterium]
MQTLTMRDFLAQTEGGDRAFLGADLSGFLAVCAGMANGDGGWAILGAEVIDDQVKASGVNNPSSLIEVLRARLCDREKISANSVSSFQILRDGDKNLLAVRIEPADWFLRPVTVAGEAEHAGKVLAYRRIEDNTVVSGLAFRFGMALDALESSRDDYPTDFSVNSLDDADVASYRAAVTALRPEWGELSGENFLKRALVTDDDGRVTRAGQLAFGLPSSFDAQNKPLVRVKPIKRFKGVKIQTAHNLWSAWTNLMPPVLDFLEPSTVCVDAVRECFLMAFMGADYDAGHIEVELGGETLTFHTPGFPRFHAGLTPDARNLRLVRIFAGAGISSRGGLEIIKACDKDFRTGLDTLDIQTSYELNLNNSQPEPEPAQPLKILPSYLLSPSALAVQ